MSALGAGAEFDRIRAIAAMLGPRAAELGDDCALVPIDGGFLAISTDVSVDEVHFRRDWLTLTEVGWRAAAAALSDLAAVGADPAGILVALTAPSGLTEQDVVALMDGAGAAASAVGAPVLGGDLSAGATLQLAVTVVGSTGRWLGRGGARAGDGLWVTGALGGARAALLAWQEGREPDPRAREAFARPYPRLAAGQWLAQAGARAMIDLSDGLAGDAAHLAASSGLRMRVELDRVPLHPSIPLDDPHAAVFLAARGGEDYELLAAMSPIFTEREAAAMTSQTGVALTRIGAVEEGEGAQLMLGGTAVTLDSFSHFT
ncbi:MAG: thiamine-phosphate kinase [Gemmatimonadota bacterium]|nr:thiamine-phosphate kinase [Gemmatimonadota bacterium]